MVACAPRSRPLSPPPSFLPQRRFRETAGVQTLRCPRGWGAGGKRRHCDSYGRESALTRLLVPLYHTAWCLSASGTGCCFMFHNSDVVKTGVEAGIDSVTYPSCSSAKGTSRVMSTPPCVCFLACRATRPLTCFKNCAPFSCSDCCSHFHLHRRYCCRTLGLAWVQ